MNEEFSKVVASQRLKLTEISKLLDEMKIDLKSCLSKEEKIKKELEKIDDEFIDIKSRLKKLGVSEKKLKSLSSNDSKSCLNKEILRTDKKYARIKTDKFNDFNDLIKKSESYLEENNIDLSKDPLLQIIDSKEIRRITDKYRKEYGDIKWDKLDYIIVILAGFIATLIDILVVKIPEDTNFLGELQEGSKWTKRIKNKSSLIQEKYLKKLEDKVKVSYDHSTDRYYDENIDGMNPHFHRLMSLGHDPVFGIIFGFLDILGGTGTFIDKYGDVTVTQSDICNPESNKFIAFIQVFGHLLSDVCTSAGIQPPFFTVLQLVKAKSPFVLGKSGKKVSWTNVARYMYKHGYDFRHFLVMGLVPAVVEIIIRGYWLFKKFDTDADPKLIKVKLSSMLTLGHTIALSGNLIKTGVFYNMNPTALNWAEILRFFPVVFSWIKESSKRKKIIRKKLNEEWIDIYKNVGV